MGWHPRRWHDETWICSLRGHVCPAAQAEAVGPEDAALGFDADDGTRLARCLRCDVWLRTDPPAPGTARWPRVPPVGELALPLRGEPLRQRLVLRLIAVERSLHVLVFGALAVVGLLVELRLPAVQGWALGLVDDLQTGADATSRGGQHRWLTDGLDKVADLSAGTLWWVVAAAAAYAVVESFETVGLWRGRRWAEYLTAVVTASLLPFEVWELVDEGPSVLKVLTMAANLAILAYLVWAKRLFGLRGGAASLVGRTDWAAVLADPRTADAATRIADHPGGLAEPAAGAPPAADRSVGPARP